MLHNEDDSTHNEEEEEVIRWKTTFNQQSMDEKSLATLKQRIQQSLMTTIQTRKQLFFTLMDINIQLDSEDDTSWKIQFFYEHIHPLIYSMEVGSIPIAKIEYYLNQLKYLKLTQGSLCYEVLLHNTSFMEYCNSNPELLRDILQQVIRSYITEIRDTAVFHAMASVILIFEEKLPVSVHLVIHQVLTEVFYKDNDSPQVILELLKVCKCMRLAYYSCNLMISMLKHPDDKLKIACCSALAKCTDLVQLMYAKKNDAKELFAEICNCAKSPDVSLRSEVYFTLSQLIANSGTPIEESDRENLLFHYIEPIIFELVAGDSSEYETDRHFLAFVSMYFAEKHPVDLSQTELNKIDNMVFKLITNKKIQQLYPIGVMKLIAPFIYPRVDMNPTKSFLFGIDYCIFFVLKHSSLSASNEKISNFVVFALEQILSYSATIRWLYLNNCDKLHRLCDIFIFGEFVNQPKASVRVMQCAFNLINNIVTQDFWDTVLIRKDETLCEFIIRFMSTSLSSTSTNGHMLAPKLLVIILSQSITYLSQEEKQVISDKFNIELLCSDLLEDEDSTIHSLVVVQFYHLEKETLNTISRHMNSIALNVWLEISSMTPSNLYFIIYSFIDLLIDLKQHSYKPSLYEYANFELLFVVLDSMELDIQPLLMRFERLKVLTKD
jgi:hypothetical protein